MKKIIYLSIILSIILLVGSFLLFQSRQSIFPDTTVQSSFVKINGHIIKVEIADDFEEQKQGLSDRESLCEDCGMLFVFPRKQVRSFWMKNMNFPIDIIWIQDKKIVHISENLSPEGEAPEETYSSILPVNYVLEVNAGITDNYGIKMGDKINLNLK